MCGPSVLHQNSLQKRKERHQLKSWKAWRPVTTLQLAQSQRCAVQHCARNKKERKKKKMLSCLKRQYAPHMDLLHQIKNSLHVGSKPCDDHMFSLTKVSKRKMESSSIFTHSRVAWHEKKRYVCIVTTNLIKHANQIATQQTSES